MPSPIRCLQAPRALVPTALDHVHHRDKRLLRKRIARGSLPQSPHSRTQD